MGERNVKSDPPAVGTIDFVRRGAGTLFSYVGTAAFVEVECRARSKLGVELRDEVPEITKYMVKILLFDLRVLYSLSSHYNGYF